MKRAEGRKPAAGRGRARPGGRGPRADADRPAGARDLVTWHIQRQAKRFPQLAPGGLVIGALDERDTALAHAIDQAVLRRWLTLATVIDSRLDRQWQTLQPFVKAPLLVGAAQLLLLDRIPDHAAIGEAVRWTRAAGGAGAAGLVNAVLRRVAELRGEVVAAADPARRDELPLSDGRAWRLKGEVFPEDPTERLIRKTSHRPELVRRWIQQHGQPAAEALAHHSLVHPPVILSGVGADDPRVVPHEAEGFAVYRGPRGGVESLLRDWPGARVQDPTAAAPVQGTAALHPKLVADVCAGRGTKTGQLADLHPDALIVASEPDPERRAVLGRTFDGHDRVRVVTPERLIEHAGRADLVVLDVPCSNTGVLARRVEAKYRFDAETLESLVSLQRQIIADALPLLAEAGTLLYATCSIDAAENEEQVRWIGRWHHLEATAMWSRLPRGLPGEPPAAYADGGFFALLRR